MIEHLKPCPEEYISVFKAIKRMSYVTDADKVMLEHNFKYHAPKDGQPFDYDQIRQAGKRFAELICERVPTSRERATALTRIEEAIFWANAGVARNT